uniref:Uncharacterized protein n=1 Tax=Saccharum officinarum TaxID=4547 RepID=A0A678TQD1_SACOF|nr:hypothetical protein SO37C23_000001 [Saccharum officinarum]
MLRGLPGIRHKSVQLACTILKGPCSSSNSSTKPLVGKQSRGAAGSRLRPAVGVDGGGGAAGEDQGSRAHTLGCPAWPDAAYGGAATVAAAATAAVPMAGLFQRFRLRRGAPVVEEDEAEAMVHAVGHERARRQQGCGGGKLSLPAMVDAAALSATKGQSEKGRVRENAERAWRVSGFTKCEREQQRRVARRWDARQQWRARSAAWLTRRPTVEHLACVGEGKSSIRVVGARWQVSGQNPSQPVAILLLRFLTHGFYGFRRVWSSRRRVQQRRVPGDLSRNIGLVR